jgi:hypothetical protein
MNACAWFDSGSAEQLATLLQNQPGKLLQLIGNSFRVTAAILKIRCRDSRRSTYALRHDDAGRISAVLCDMYNGWQVVIEEGAVFGTTPLLTFLNATCPLDDGDDSALLDVVKP